MEGGEELPLVQHGGHGQGYGAAVAAGAGAGPDAAEHDAPAGAGGEDPEPTAALQPDEERLFHSLLLVQLGRWSCSYYFLLSFMVGFVFAVDCVLRIFYSLGFPLLYDTAAAPTDCGGSAAHAAGEHAPRMTETAGGGQHVLSYFAFILFATGASAVFGLYLTSAWVLTKSSWAGRDLLELKHFDFYNNTREGSDADSNCNCNLGCNPWSWSYFVSFVYQFAMPILPLLMFTIGLLREGGSVLYAMGSLIETALWCGFVMTCLFSVMVFARTFLHLCSLTITKCCGEGNQGRRECASRFFWSSPEERIELDAPDRIMSVVDRVDAAFYNDVAPTVRVPFKPAQKEPNHTATNLCYLCCTRCAAAENEVTGSDWCKYWCGVSHDNPEHGDARRADTRRVPRSPCGHASQRIVFALLLVLAILRIATRPDTSTEFVGWLVGLSVGAILLHTCSVKCCMSRYSAIVKASNAKKAATVVLALGLLVGFILSAVCGWKSPECLRWSLVLGLVFVWIILYLTTKRLAEAPFISRDEMSNRYAFTNLLKVWWNMWLVLAAVIAAFAFMGANPDQGLSNTPSSLARGAAHAATGKFSYPVCHHAWADAPGLTIVDAAYAAILAYDSVNATTLDKDAKNWFPDTEWEIVRTTNTDFVQLLILNHHLPPDDKGTTYDYSLVSIRGSSVDRDWVFNADIWSEAALLQVFSIFIPSLPLFPDKVVSSLIKFCSNVFQTIVPQVLEGPSHSYVDEIECVIGQAKSLGEIRSDNIIYVGHSLGGGLAKLVGTITERPSISFSGPGLLFTRGKFGLTNGNLNKLVTQVTPRFDIVPKIDIQQGFEQHINCGEEFAPTQQPIACHGIRITTCELARVCGDPRGRNEYLVVPDPDATEPDLHAGTTCW